MGLYSKKNKKAIKDLGEKKKLDSLRKEKQKEQKNQEENVKMLRTEAKRTARDNNLRQRGQNLYNAAYSSKTKKI